MSRLTSSISRVDFCWRLLARSLGGSVAGIGFSGRWFWRRRVVCGDILPLAVDSSRARSACLALPGRMCGRDVVV